MLKFLIIALVFGAIYSLETRKLIAKKEIKELIVFSFLVLIGFVLSIILVFKSYI